jgi:hypothetical protein
MSRTNAHVVASVCHRPLPMPTATDSASSTQTPADGRPKREARSQAAQAAIRKDALVSAFSGSASSPGPVRSQ